MKNKPNKPYRTRLVFERVEDRHLLSADGIDAGGVDQPQPIPGDIDRDGEVGFQDFLIFADSFGRQDSVWDSGDLNGDAITDFADFLILARSFGTVAPTLDDLQLASLRDRTVNASGYEEFREATAVPNTSPVLSLATDSDLIVRYDGQADSTELTAVVLKPRSNGIVYELPIPSPEENQFEFLKDHFKQAIREQACLILFPQDHTFEIVPPLPTTRHLKLEGFQDVTIDLNGSTLAFTQVSPGILIEDSQRVVIRNGSIRGHGVLATIAKVVPDDTATGLGFELLPEYRELLERDGLLPSIFTIGSAENSEAGWRIKTDGFEEMFVNRGEPTDNFVYDTLRGTVRAISPASYFPFEEGDHVWIQHQNNAAPGIFLDNEVGAGIEDVSLEQLRISNIPGMQIVGEVIRGLHIDGVRIETDSNDPLAVFAGASDSIHINANGGDIVIENSYLGPNADDKITIKGNYWQITAIDSVTNVVTAEPVERNTSLTRWGSAGERVAFIDDGFGVLGSATLVEDSIRDSGKRHLIRLDQIPAGVEVGTVFGNVDNSGGRVVIRNNEMSQTRAQAVLVQTSHVVVEDNSFSHIAGPVIKLNLALHKWFESISVQNVLIRNNRFSESSRSATKSNELITLFQIDRCLQPVQIMDGITIVGNSLDNSELSTADPTDLLSPEISEEQGEIEENPPESSV